MVNTINLFREYILWRSRVVTYVAVALVILSGLGLIVLISASAVNINRFGLALQLLGALALIPDVFGKEKFIWLRRIGGRQAAQAESEPELVPLEDDPGLPVTGENAADAVLERRQGLFTFYQTRNLTIVLGNALASLGFMWLLADYVLQNQVDHFAEEHTYRVLLSLVGFAWLNIFMLIHACRLMKTTAPRGMLAWFFAIDFCVSIVGIAFAGVAHILLAWVGRITEFIYRSGIRRVVLVITLPCFIVGLAFELLATFLTF